MKKIILSLIFVVLISSSAFAKANEWGIRYGSLIPAMTSERSTWGQFNNAVPNVGLFYNFTDAITGSLGFCFIDNPPESGSSSSTMKYLGINLAGFYYFGSGALRPRLGIEANYWSKDSIDGGTKNAIFLAAALLFGGEAMIFEKVSLTFDVRVLDCSSHDWDEYNRKMDTDFTFFSGAALGFCWYLL